MKKCLTILLFCLFGQLASAQVITGAEQMDRYISMLKNKRVGVVVNHTSMVGNTHLIDKLNDLEVDITYIFAPEHGFRGKKSAGEHINHEVDSATGIKIFSLHGATKSPSAQSLKDVDVMLFDLQDVGLRFYTYISTLYYIMSTAAEYNKEVIVLDRPNPNIYYVDGPVLDMKHESFVGLYPIPIVYGMTIGELAIMANNEGWLKHSAKCDLTVIELDNYTRKTRYSLPIAPSPNLPNSASIQLYANLCLFEGTTISVGRGTKYPFQQYGSPEISGYKYNFTPTPNEGAKNPPQNGKKCYGVLLNLLPDWELYSGEFSLKYIIDAYKRTGMSEKFFNPFFEKLVGVSYVRKMIKEGYSAEDISQKWEKDITKFKKKREQYLIYK